MYTPEQRPSDLVKDELPDVDAPSAKPTEDEVLEAMKDVVDPELMVNVVDLGLVYGVQVDDEANATIDMTLTSPTCPLTDKIEYDTKYVLDGLVNSVTINWVWMPPWTLEAITDDGREQLAGRRLTTSDHLLAAPRRASLKPWLPSRPTTASPCISLTRGARVGPSCSFTAGRCPASPSPATSPRSRRLATG